MLDLDICDYWLWETIYHHSCTFKPNLLQLQCTIKSFYFVASHQPFSFCQQVYKKKNAMCITTTL
jgi:hypothetical protein